MNWLNFFFNRFHFQPPVKIDFLIFDETHSDLIINLIPKEYSKLVFRNRPVIWNIHPRVFFSFFTNLKYFDFKALIKPLRGLLKEILWQLHMVYIKSEIDLAQPRVVLTFIDNSAKFAWLSQRSHRIPCIGIQNGFRLSDDSNSSLGYYCHYLFCFGQHEVKKFPSIGYKVDHFIPVGSLLLSTTRNEIPNFFEMDLDKKETDFDLLIVSCWRGNIGFGQDVQDSMAAMRLMDMHLSKYLRTRSLKAAVILRSERDSVDWIMDEVGMSEEDYYLSIYNDSLQIIDANFQSKNIYPTMFTSDVIIAGHGTTCLVEALAFGKKILYANFSGSDKYHKDFAPEIVFKGSDYNAEEFYKRLDDLLQMTNEEFNFKNSHLLDFYVRDPRKIDAAAEIWSGLEKISGLLKNKKGIQ